MQANKTLSFARMLLVLFIGAHGSLGLAQQGPSVRFSNWEFTPPQGMQKVEQTADKLVFKLDKSIPGPGGTITLQAGQPLKGTLASRLDGEWKQLTKGRKLSKTEPDEQTELADGTKGLKRSASTANGGNFSITAYAAPNGINLLIMDAADEMATQILGGATFGFFMSAKLLPVGQPMTVAQPSATKSAKAPPAETPLEEVVRLKKEMMQEPMSDFPGTGALRVPGFPAVASMTPPAKPAYDLARVPVPPRDAARVRMVPSTVPRDKALVEFIRQIESAVRQKLPKTAQAACNSLQREAKKGQLTALATGNMAVGLWMMGAPETALCLMGKALLDDPANADNLNNYAALLTMAGGEHLALPILIKLDHDFPGNSTILNNMGQAWFGLGEIAKADDYLNKALTRFARHSQANFTKSVIAEHKGDRRGAIEAMRKSMAQGYSDEKEGQLERLGHKISEADYTWDIPRKEEPLKLHKFLPLVPPYPKSVAELPQAKVEWQSFRDQLQAEIETLNEKRPAMKEAAQNEWRQFTADMAAGRRRFSPVQIKFSRKYVTHSKLQEKFLEQPRRWAMEQNAAEQQIAGFLKTATAVIRNPNATCAGREKAASAFLKQANTVWEDLQREEKLKEKIRWNEDLAHMLLYYNDPGDATYQLHLLSIKAGYLQMLKGLKLELSPDETCGAPAPPTRGKRRPLPHFEDLHCEKNINFTVPFIGSIHVNCHYISTEFDVAGIITGKTKEDLNTGEFVRGTVEIWVKLGKTASTEFGGKYNPLAAEVSAKVGGFLEFDGNGLSDIGLQAGAKVSAGTNVLDKAKAEPWSTGTEKETRDMLSRAVGKAEREIDVGTSIQIGLNSGVRVRGSGYLGGLAIESKW